MPLAVAVAMRIVRAVTLSCLAGCQQGALPPADPIPGVMDLATEDAPGTSPPHDAASPWPRRVTLSSHGGGPDEGLRLADGSVSAGPADLVFHQAMVLSLRSPTSASICAKGTFASLAAVPVGETDCPGSPSMTWAPVIYLSASAIHRSEESSAIGRSFLARDATAAALYRARILGDSYDASGLSTVTLEYEPVP